MKANQASNYSWLFKASVRLLKYYGYFFVGLFGVCVLAAILGFFPIVQVILAIIGEWILRIFGVLLTLAMTAIVYESLRY